MNLSDRFAQLADGMDLEERGRLKILLAAAVAELLPGGAMPDNPTTLSALQAAVSTIAKMQPHRDRVPSNAVVYRGRPEWMTTPILEGLREESAALRPGAVRFHDHYVVSGARLASEVARSASLTALIRHHVGPVAPTGKANYLYYDEEGLGIEPHLDTEDFSLNVILMLEHIRSETPSALVLYPSALPPERIYLEPGEMIVFFADSIIHARERMKPGETIRIAAFGFAPEIHAHDD